VERIGINDSLYTTSPQNAAALPPNMSGKRTGAGFSQSQQVGRVNLLA
jgi:hypothetical protein